MIWFVLGLWLVVMVVLGFVFHRWQYPHHPSFPVEDGKVVRKNVRRRCKQCGRTVVTDVFMAEPICVLCQEKRPRDA